MGRDLENMKKWRKENQKRFEIYFNTESDKKTLEWFEKQPNKRQYILQLIEADRKKEED